MGTIGNSAFLLVYSFQWELHSCCQKSKGTEFPCIAAEIKHWLLVKNCDVHVFVSIHLHISIITLPSFTKFSVIVEYK